MLRASYALILFHHSNHAATPGHEGRTRRWLYSTATLREWALPYLFVAGHHHYMIYQLAFTRYSAHSTWCQAGSPQRFTCLPSHRRSRRISNRRNKPGDWRTYRLTLNKSPSGTSRSVFVLTHCNGNGRRRQQKAGTAEASTPTDTPVWLPV